MKNMLLVLALLCLSVSTQSKQEWGFFGHRHIGRLAVFTLPPEMMVFYKQHLEWITEHSPDPDRRRYAIKAEAPRHFIDLDRWGKPPFEVLTRDWREDAMRHTDLFLISELGDTTQLLDTKTMDWNQETIRFGGEVVLVEDYRQFFGTFVFNQDDFDCEDLRHLTGRDWPCGEIVMEDHLFENGLNPYITEVMIRSLTKAFRDRDVSKILHKSVDLGHYIGDGHVPLHTTENYNGQLTGQLGIHAFWESRLPELFADKEYDYFVGKADYVKNKRAWIWDYVLDSHALVDSVLLLERHLRDTYPQDQQMCFEQRGPLTINTQCPEFARTYHDAMNGMVERRFRHAIHSVGSAWFTAWTDAGQPDLSQLDAEAVYAEQDSLKHYKQTGKIKGRAHWD